MTSVKVVSQMRRKMNYTRLTWRDSVSEGDLNPHALYGH